MLGKVELPLVQGAARHAVDRASHVDHDKVVVATPLARVNGSADHAGRRIARVQAHDDLLGSAVNNVHELVSGVRDGHIQLVRRGQNHVRLVARSAPSRDGRVAEVDDRGPLPLTHGIVDVEGPARHWSGGRVRGHLAVAAGPHEAVLLGWARVDRLHRERRECRRRCDEEGVGCHARRHGRSIAVRQDSIYYIGASM